MGIFDPAFRTVAPLTFSLVQLSPLPPLPCVKKYTVCKGGGGGSGPQTDNHLQQSQVNFLDDGIAFYDSYLSMRTGIGEEGQALFSSI